MLGGGGHAKVLVATLKLAGVHILGIVDNDAQLWGKQLLGVDIIGGEDVMGQYSSDEVFLVNGIGSIQLPVKRKQLYNRFKSLKYRFANVIHPSSIISENVELGEGVQIMAGVIIQPGCSVGDNAILNSRVTVDHDCSIGEHAHLAPGVTLSGSVRIGCDTHIGTAAAVIQNVEVGDRCVIGAGSLVLKNIPSDVTAFGVPAKVV